MDVLTKRCFLQQFDKGTAQCVLPENYTLRCCIEKDVEFDLIDKKEEMVLPNGQGGVTYKNETSDGIVVIDYENLVQSFPSTINTGKKAPHCCDFLVYSDNESSFFICNELSVSPTHTKWPDARNQFSDTVRALLKCAETKKMIENYTNKLCVLSTTIEKTDSPENIAGAFNIPYFLQKNAEQLHWTIVERMGFSIWESNLVEYKSDKTVELSVR